jgi:hypothetical protein
MNLLLRPTFADLYDRATGGQALVGAIVAVTWHLYMASHGALWGGGDEDLAVMRSADASAGGAWHVPERLRPFFAFPGYVNELPGIGGYARDLDRADGRLDGRWLANDISALRDGLDTPARIPFQTDVIREVIDREGFGDDDVTDLLFANHKVIDHIGHLYSVNSPEMQATLRAQDADLQDLIEILNRSVGRGRWVLLLTADHGHQLDPEVSGAFRMTHGQVKAAIEERFDDGDGVDLVEAMNATQIFLDQQERAEPGSAPQDVARFLLGFTEGDGARYGATVAGEASDRVFDAAIPRDLLRDLPCGGDA